MYNYFNKKFLWLFAIALLLLILIFLWQYLPYQNFASRQIINILEYENIKVSALKVESANSSEIIISNIKLDENPGLSIGNLKLKYNLRKLATGRLNDIEAENIQINLYRKDGKFQVSGLEKVLSSTSQSDNKLPIDAASLQNIAPARIDIKNLNILAKDEDWQLSLPLNLTFNLNPLSLLMASTGLNLDIKPYKLVTENISLNALWSESQKWQGEMVIPSVTITGLQDGMPPFSTNINFTLDAENLSAKIIMNDDNGLIKTDMELFLPVASPTSGNLNIKQIQFPFGGGLISSGAINVPLDMQNPILFAINLQNVNLADTLGKLSNERVKGVGKISGMFPIIYNPDGTVILKDGMAQDINEGIISVSPELLPGDNAGVELARTLLQNFHYTRLKIMVSSKEDKSAINLVLEGKNPDNDSKRPIKFNINLTGDIMPLIEQSIIPFNDIKKLLKQEKP